MEPIKNKDEYRKEEIYITRTHKIHISNAHTPRVGFFCCRQRAEISHAASGVGDMRELRSVSV